MKGIEFVNSGIRVVNDRNIVRVPLKSGNKILLQLNDKTQEIDTLTLSKGKVINAETFKNHDKTEGAFDEMIAGFVEKLEPLTEKSPFKIISELIHKAVK